MRQVRRAYRHLPPELHEQGFDQAAVALRTGAPSTLDRRSLYAELARVLDDELRRIHVGWCLNQARVTTQAEPVVSAPSGQQAVAAFVEQGLGGLERAVLQLELGAGRDTSTVKAVLRLPARQYARHRELGLGKLRGAIAGGLSGRVCEQHLEAVTLAATGDRDAADRLASGPARCRACAREASGLRRVLQQRLALAPWPLAIKPAGAIAAKLGALGAVLGGKGAAGGIAGTGFTGTASGAKVVAAVVTTAALASGGIAAVESATPGSQATPAASKAAPAAPAATTAAPAPATGTRPKAASGRRRAGSRRTAAKARPPRATAPTPDASAQPQGAQPAGAGQAPASQSKPTDAVRKAIDGVKKTVDDVTGALPAPVPQVDEVAPGLDHAVDDLSGAVDGLLAP